MPETTVPIYNILHPLYTSQANDWYKWRLTYEGGTRFMDEYLRRHSKAEEKEDFIDRKNISYVPAFSKAALIEVRNSIYQRLTDITRVGGSPSYQAAIIGNDGGVDLRHSSMNTFIGTEVLEELLTMRRVGIYVDAPPKQGPTLADNVGIRPYLYIYKVEDIRSWDVDETATTHQYRAILLRDTIYQRDDFHGLPTGLAYRYRYYWRDGNGEVWVQLYDADSNPISPYSAADINNLADFEYNDSASNRTESENGNLNTLLDYTGPLKLGISRIPFITLEINNSLLADIADYQIALMNLASADMAYAVGANFPFYTEQFDPRYESSHIKGPTTNSTIDTDGGVIASDSPIPSSSSMTVNTGPSSGRRYAKGLNKPEFVHPSAEPMKASMAKQEQLKTDIRLLINLAITNVQPKMASAESKGFDERTLESGLAYIGLILEDAERQIANIWHEYEGSKATYAVKYPEKYTLKQPKEVWEEVDQLKKNMSSTPSVTYKRTLAKRIAELLVGNRVTNETLTKIYSEIDKADVVDVLIEKIEKDVAGGYLDPELAAKLRGYPIETVKKAQEFRVQRIKEIQTAQSPGGGFGANVQSSNGQDQGNQGNQGNPPARGNPDISPSGNPKQDVQQEKAAAGNPVRGKADKAQTQ